VARVAAGAVAKKLLSRHEVRIIGHTVAVGGVWAKTFDEAEVEQNPVRCADPEAAVEMERTIREVAEAGDSIGGVVEVRALGVPKGWGDPVFMKLDARLAHAMMSIGGVKAVEIGAGFAAAAMRGSEHNDPITPQGFVSNNAGGILGGISNGEPIVVRLAVKPTSSIALPQRTVDVWGHEQTLSISGRHDPCLCPRIVPVAEAMAALVLADACLTQQAVSGAEKDLHDLRDAIDLVDADLVAVLAQRFALVEEVGRLKREAGLPIMQPAREQEVRDRFLALAKAHGLAPTIAAPILDLLLALSRDLQGRLA